MNKYLFGGVAVVALGVLLFFGSSGVRNAETGAQVSSALAVEETAYDFGDLEIFGGKAEKDFMLTNQGQESITILNGTTSCGCTEGSIDGILFGMHEAMAESVLVEPGETKTLTVIYDPLAHGPDAVGSITRQIFLKTNSTATPEIEIQISANVVKKAN